MGQPVRSGGEIDHQITKDATAIRKTKACSYIHSCCCCFISDTYSKLQAISATELRPTTPADLDNLAALHLHQLAQVLLQEAGVGAPLQQAKKVHYEETTA